MNTYVSMLYKIHSEQKFLYYLTNYVGQLSNEAYKMDVPLSNTHVVPTAAKFLFISEEEFIGTNALCQNLIIRDFVMSYFWHDEITR